MRCFGRFCEWYRREAASGMCMCPGVDAEKHLSHGNAVSRIDGKNRVWVSPPDPCIGEYQPREQVTP